jgi:hypothetical protein
MTHLDTADETTAMPEDPTKPVSRDRARHRRGSSDDVAPRTARRRRLWPFWIASLVFVGALLVMAWQGYETSLDIKGGTALNGATNPKAAGYEAQVNPTPTHLLVNVDADGKIGDLEMLVDDSNGKGGGVLFIPGLTVVKLDSGAESLSDVAQKKGMPALVDAVQRALGIAVTDSFVVKPDQLDQLFTPTGPLTIENPDNLTRKTGGAVTTVYAAGSLTLQPKDVSAFLDFANDGEAVVNRTARAEQVWEAWFQKLASGGASVAPKVAPIASIAGGDPVDVSSLVTGLAGGSIDFQQLPLDRLPVPNQGGFAIYEPNAASVADLMSRMVPFPGSAFPGQRVRVRLLNGTADPDAALRAATPIVSANAQILVLGNASSFDVASTRVEYNSDQQINAAKAIATKLGAGPPVPGDDSDAIDVTVTLGKDFRG